MFNDCCMHAHETNHVHALDSLLWWPHAVVQLKRRVTLLTVECLVSLAMLQRRLNRGKVADETLKKAFAGSCLSPDNITSAQYTIRACIASRSEYAPHQ
jgi:hypothetical protein